MPIEPISRDCRNALRILNDSELLKIIFSEDSEPDFIKGSVIIVRLLVLYREFKASDLKLITSYYRGKQSNDL